MCVCVSVAGYHDPNNIPADGMYWKDTIPVDSIRDASCSAMH